MGFRKIEITDIPGFKLGNAEDIQGGTGCTAVICEKGAVTGADVRGGGPATRETDLLRSENTVSGVHCVMLSGGTTWKKRISDSKWAIFVFLSCVRLPSTILRWLQKISDLIEKWGNRPVRMHMRECSSTVTTVPEQAQPSVNSAEWTEL